MADLEGAMLKALHEGGTIADSGAFAAASQAEHQAVVGTIKSLQASEMVAIKVGACMRE